MLSFFLPLFMVFLFLGLPVFFGLIAAPGLLLLMNGQERDIVLLYRNVYNGMDSFPLMAIPFFMLAGEVMNKSNITLRLVEFSQAMIGHFRGGLAHVNVLSSMLFAGLSGSAVADVSALGSMLIPAMEQQGYSRKFAAAITASSAIIGPIIPPSGIMIIYAYVMGESVAALFLAGIVPGILIGGSLMLMISVLAERYDLPKRTQKASWTQRGNASLKAIWPLMTPVIILGGILGGIFTPTEAAAIAVGYSVVIGLFVMRSLKFRDLPDIMLRSGMTSAVVLLLVGAAMAFKTVASLSHTPELLADIILGLSDQEQQHQRIVGQAKEDVRQSAGVAVPDQYLAVHRWHVPRRGPGDHHPGPDPGADLYLARGGFGAFRHHHGRQPDRRPADAADGPCAVCHLFRLGPSG